MSEWVDPTPIYTRLMAERESTPIFDQLLEKYEWAKYEELVEPYQPTKEEPCLTDGPTTGTRPNVFEKPDNEGETLMKKSYQELVNEFREAMDLPISPIPRTLSTAEAELHIQMIRDEFEKEFVPAALDADPQNLVELYDAGIDLIVYILGAMSNAGLDVDPGFRVVMESNMSKMDPETGLPIKAGPNDPSGEPEGKVLKGPDYWKPEPKLWEIINQTYQEGPRDESVYRVEKVPLTWDIGGPVVGEASVYMDHEGNIMAEGVVFETDDIPEIKSLVASNVGGLSIFVPDEAPEVEAAEDQRMPGEAELEIDYNDVAYMDVEGRIRSTKDDREGR